MPPRERSSSSLLDAETESLINTARDYCQALNFTGTDWKGVPPREDRAEQARESMVDLVPFMKDIKRLDLNRWSEFEAWLQHIDYKKRKNVEEIINYTYLDKDSARWSLAAADEIPYLIQFIEGKQFVLDQDVSRLISPEFLLNLTEEFLRERAGEGDKKVVLHNKDGVIFREGFDGQERTCPVAWARMVAIRYFTLAIAEYFLMKNIVFKVKNKD